MDVILLRHGKAGDRDPKLFPDDTKRPLTAEGALELRDICTGLRRIGLAFDFLVTSPLLRAHQTADIVAEVFEWKEPPQVSDVLGQGCTTGKVIALLAKFPPDARVALVGHEPDLSRVAAELIGRSGDAALELKKGGVACVRYEGPAAMGLGTLAFLFKPSQLRKIGRNAKR